MRTPAEGEGCEGSDDDQPLAALPESVKVSTSIDTRAEKGSLSQGAAPEARGSHSQTRPTTICCRPAVQP